VQGVKTKRDLEVRDCGLMVYYEALSLQNYLLEQRQKGQIGNTILILEHPPVITLGARNDLNKLLVEKNIPAQRGFEIARVRRGGGCTAHNPGQVVLYPIIKLPPLGLGVSDYIRTLESIGLELLEQFGVLAERRRGFPGLWTKGGKIASIGVRIRRGVTSHGMAININNDLSIFETIVPCGLEGVEITSVLKQTATEHPMTQVKKRLAVLCFKHLAGRNVNLVNL
jgi:lipoyl(octanoyl) transferase